MLSRTADHLFWMNRYTERAENTARLLDVNYQTSLLPQSTAIAQKGWQGLLSISELLPAYKEKYDNIHAKEVMDFMVKDAIGRKWQLGTIQVDYNLPERFDLTYIGEDNQKHRPVMIHRAPFGSLERFIALLTEHCAGKFPVWLAPVQAKILPISDKFLSYAQ